MIWKDEEGKPKIIEYGDSVNQEFITQWYPVVSDVKGKLKYSIDASEFEGFENDECIIIPSAGKYAITMEFNPLEPGYERVLLHTELVVEKKIPDLCWRNGASPLIYGSTLTDEHKMQAFVKEPSNLNGTFDF